MNGIKTSVAYNLKLLFGGNMNIRSLGMLLGSVICMTGLTFAQQTVDPKLEQQIRVLAAQYDEAFNKSDATALGALFSEDAVFSGLHGKFKGRQAIVNFHSQQVFARWHANNRVTTVDRVDSVSDEVSSSGRWSETVQSNGSKNIGGTYSWVLIRDGDSWKIRMANYSEQY
jgi:uncharacterized protein (TIGR02246 family)